MSVTAIYAHGRAGNVLRLSTRHDATLSFVRRPGGYIWAQVDCTLLNLGLRSRVRAHGNPMRRQSERAMHRSLRARA